MGNSIGIGRTSKANYRRVGSIMLAWDAIEICGVLANETRFAILSQLSHSASSGMTISRLALRTGASRSAISRQVQLLSETGLVLCTREGRHILCRANFALLDEFLGLMNRRLTPPRALERSPAPLALPPPAAAKSQELARDTLKSRLAAVAKSPDVVRSVPARDRQTPRLIVARRPAVQRRVPFVRLSDAIAASGASKPGDEEPA